MDFHANTPLLELSPAYLLEQDSSGYNWHYLFLFFCISVWFMLKRKHWCSESQRIFSEIQPVYA